MKSNNRLFFVLRAVLAAATVAAGLSVLAHACGWSLLHEHSVRFNGYSSVSQFTRLPGLPRDPTTAMACPYSPNSEEAYVPEIHLPGQGEEEQEEQLWQKANQAEADGHLALLPKHLRAYLAFTDEAAKTDWLGESNQTQKRRNSARDRLDALSALSQGAATHAIKSYLAARALYDSEMLSLETLDELLAAAKPAVALTDNFAYLRAVTYYRDLRYNEAADAFAALRKRYPHSEKADAALFMQGLSLRGELRLKCGAHSSSVAAQQEALELSQKAKKVFQQYLNEYPQGRYALDARGWLAHLAFQRADYAAALVEYYRILAAAPAVETEASVVVSLRMTRHRAKPEEMQQVEAELADEPAAAFAYAYHSLYNYLDHIADEIYEPTEEVKEAYDLQELQRENLQKTVETQERARITAFASRMLKRYDGAAGAAFALRLAQAQLESENHHEALEAARRALQGNLTSRMRAEAWFVKGSAEFRLGRFVAAQQTMRQLRATYPGTEIAEQAGRLLAMAAEDAGDWEGALLQYIEMDYRDDVAYFADVLLTPQQLAQFIKRHPRHRMTNELQYALAVRYLRLHDWPAMRAALAKVSVTESGLTNSDYWSNHYNVRNDFSHNCTPPKLGAANGIAARWLMRDLQTANDLERLEQNVHVAQDDEARAEALYQRASYLYQSNTLLFYNPALWTGRHYKLADLARLNLWRAKNEYAVLWQHMQQHEPVAQAVQLYLEIVRLYPNTRAAKDALYTAAIGHERLMNYNSYWRGIYNNGMHAGERMVTYADVRAAYPRYRLPRATFGWEPATRTVNGGPGWATPPKPKPRPTKEQRLRALSSEINQELKTRVRPLLQGARTELKKWQETYDFYLFLIKLGIVLSLASYGGWHIYRLRQSFELASLRLGDALLAPPEESTSYVERIFREYS